MKKNIGILFSLILLISVVGLFNNFNSEKIYLPNPVFLAEAEGEMTFDIKTWQTYNSAYNAAYGVDLPTPKRDGYHFDGWYTRIYGGYMVSGEDTFSEDENITLYARWEEHIYDQKKVESDFFASGATCTEKARYYYTCICGVKGNTTFEYGEKLEHVGSATYTFDADNHWKLCVNCDTKLEETAHSGGTATCKSRKNCSVCTNLYGSFGNHSGSQCSCCEKWSCCEGCSCSSSKCSQCSDYVCTKCCPGHINLSTCSCCNRVYTNSCSNCSGWCNSCSKCGSHCECDKTIGGACEHFIYIAEQAVCERKGLWKCKYCDYKEDIDAPGHNWIIWSYDDDYHQCTVCSETEKHEMEKIEAPIECTKCGDSTEYWYECSSCIFGQDSRSETSCGH